METGIENEIVHDVASLLLEAEVLFAVVMAWIMAIFFSAMATRPSFTKWKDVLKERFWLFVVYFTLSVITVAAAYWSSFNYLSLGVVAVFLIVLLISFPLYFLVFFLRLRRWIATNPGYAMIVFGRRRYSGKLHVIEIQKIDGVVGKQMNIFSVSGKCLVPPGKHKISFVVWERTWMPRGYISQKMFDYDVEIELKSGGLYVVQEHPSLPSLNISLSCFAPNMRKMAE